MSRFRTIVVASALGLAAALASAQPAGGSRPGAGHGPMGAGPAASGPAPVHRMRAGPGAARWGSDYTPGWALMSEQERNEHRERMRSMTSYEECRAYREQHHRQMAERAKERGARAPAEPRRDACIGLKK